MSRWKKLSGIAFAVLVAAATGLLLAMSHDSPCGTGEALPANVAPMKAVVYRCYGPPRVAKLEDIAKPADADDRVIVRVRAASVNPLDWHYLRGIPYEMRAIGVGWGAPTDVRLGVDFAGTVESVGKSVTRFKPGDEVYGGADGAFGEFVSVRERGSLAAKPQVMSFEQAAAVPIAAVTALQALRDKGRLQAGQNVLINGASGGVGTFAVQIAKALGAHVTAVCSTRNIPMVQSLGADRVIDYTREDFTRGTQRYDLIIDNVATHSLGEYRRVLDPAGKLVMVGGLDIGSWMMPMLLRMLQASAYSAMGSQEFMAFFADLNHDDLAYLGGLIQSGQVTSVIDRTFPLTEVPAALAYLEQGHVRGKIVVTVP
jgi:NADPH:quinone reductase-like Zn-dependent oxidoreductase